MKPIFEYIVECQDYNPNCLEAWYDDGSYDTLSDARRAVRRYKSKYKQYNKNYNIPLDQVPTYRILKETTSYEIVE